MRIICCAPVFDEVTEITYDESRDAVKYASERGIEVIDLVKEDAVREKVEETLRKYPDALFFHADHGSEDKIWGNDDRPVIDLKNVGLLTGREAYNNNCSSAKKLGVEAWKQNCKAFWGYTDVFYFTTDALEEFEIAVNYGIKRRVDGLSWKECLEKTKEKMTELADKLVAAGKALAASCMRHDRDHLVCYDAHAPEPTCALRRLSIRLFGPMGWTLTRKWAVSLAIFFLGLGISLHDFCHALWQVGYPEILSWQGGYIGYALMVVAFILATYDHVQWLRKWLTSARKKAKTRKEA